MDEHEILEQLLRLPVQARRHLVATYSDAVALFHMLLERSPDDEAMKQMKQQQGIYVRIAKALLDSLDGAEPPG